MSNEIGWSGVVGLLLAGCYVGVDPAQAEEREAHVEGRWQLSEVLLEVAKDVEGTVHHDAGAFPHAKHRDEHCSLGQRPGTQRLSEYIGANFDGVGNLYGFECRPVNFDPSKPTSLHGYGRAIDIGIPGYIHEEGGGHNEVGDEIAAWLIRNAEAIGVQTIIWDNSIWSPTDGVLETRPYLLDGHFSAGIDHVNHIHVALNLAGSEGESPWFTEGRDDLPPFAGTDCEDPCWPDHALGYTCAGSEIWSCEVGADGCTSLVRVDACDGPGMACQGDDGHADCCVGTFCDDDGSDFEADIEGLAAAGVVNGCGEVDGLDNFCPEDEALRAEVLAVTMRSLGLSKEAPDAFDDDDGHWAEAHLNLAFELGITTGVAPRLFDPRTPATRSHAAAFIARAYQLPAPHDDHFTDDDGASWWAQEAHNQLYEAGITFGCGTNAFCGDRPITRKEMAAFVHRAMSKLPNPHG